MSKCNDIDLKRWRDYSDVLTDSLWLIDRRDKTGAHDGSYHGNFVPQVPHQLFTRYTKRGDWVLDGFMGSGTSLIEAQRMGRNSIGIELQQSVADEARQRIDSERRQEIRAEVLVGDSRSIDLTTELKRLGIGAVQFVLLHPPYWDIINFSDSKDDLSNAATLEEFMASFGRVIDNTTSVLERDRYCALVIGDKYANGRVIPLGFECMNAFIERGFLLKGIVVKNIGETKGKAHDQNLWRYRSLQGGFYIFKHEYVFVFQK
ncbi:MAG: hypothetical protein IJU71_07595 [Selenomonadaceae bacterium]|nr:hypothetical protein [Selenomonadaceae bacterium]